MGTLVFPGNRIEAKALHNAIARWCTCNAESPEPCPAHSLLEDERTLLHLVFVRRTVAAHQCAEWNIEA